MFTVIWEFGGRSDRRAQNYRADSGSNCFRRGRCRKLQDRALFQINEVMILNSTVLLNFSEL